MKRSRYVLYAAITLLTAVALKLWRRSKRRPITPDTRSGALAPPAAPVEKPAPAVVSPPLPAGMQRRLTLLLLGAALVLALLGQAVFAEGPASPNLSTGVALFSIATVLFTVAATWAGRFAGGAGAAAETAETWRAPERHSQVEPTREPKVDESQPVFPSLRRQPRRIALLGAVTLLTIILLDLLRADPPLPSYTLPFLLWLSAIGLYIRAVVPWPLPARPHTGSWLRAYWPDFLILAAIVWTAFALRLWDIEGIPSTLSGDEGTFGLESIRTITGEGPYRNPFTTGWLSVPMMSFYFNSLTIRMLGQTVFALRLPWVLVGTLTVVIVFQLVRRLTGTTLALMTAALLATYHFHIHFSRLGVNNAADPLLIALVLYLLYRAYDERSLLSWALCGVAVGVAQYFYFGARLAPILVGAMIVYFLARDGRRFLRVHGRGIVIMTGAAIVAGAPVIQYAIRYPNDYNARVNQISIFQPGWLQRLQEATGQDVVSILIDQLRHAALAFNVYPDRTNWYGSPRPLFDNAAGILFLLGLGYATLRPGDRRLFPMVAWWWGAMILGGVLTQTPPSSQRLVTLGPPAVFFVALALLKIGQIVRSVWDAWTPRVFASYLVASVLTISIASVHWYFVEFTPLRLYGDFNGVVATEMATYMRDRLDPKWRVYFFGPPRMYIEFGSIPYIAPDVEGVNIIEPLTAPLDPALVPPGTHAAFFFLPERLGELDWVRKTFPNGALEEIPSSWNGEPILPFIVYRVQIPSTQ
ncbi:MAG TPA: glycosyltransferase family 39 protein [Anaerolineae bacterium]|nr:glycosyltransferase family 39 protein [Anaerolineae bacterium]